jgi:glutathione S-transferase
MMKPVLYSFRRCPYAIRARMALNYAGVEFELREVLLRDKPPSMLKASAKGTVPVMLLADGTVIDESADVMRWALAQHDPDHWWSETLKTETNTLLEENDFVFKKHLDQYKYADRHPQQPQSIYRTRAENFLQQLEHRLGQQQHLVDQRLTFADVAIFPFVRQFAFVDKSWFDQAPYPLLQSWLCTLLGSALFLNVMTKYPTWCEA